MARAKSKQASRGKSRMARRGAGARAAALRPWLLRLALLATLLPLAYGAHALVERLQAQPVERVLFAGDLQHAHRDSLIQRVQPHLGAGFWGVDLEAIQRDLRADPWVYRARVERQWPRQLTVTIVEEKPIARWGAGGLLNHRGEIFQPPGAPVDTQLPLLQGPEGSAERVMRHFHASAQLLAQTPLRVHTFSLDARGSWTVALAGGAELQLGREQPLKKLQRFLLVYRQRLQGEFDRVARVDTRYVNGVAVAWREREHNES